MLIVILQARAKNMNMPCHMIAGMYKVRLDQLHTDSTHKTVRSDTHTV